jgi:hypothetical protein
VSDAAELAPGFAALNAVVAQPGDSVGDLLGLGLFSPAAHLESLPATSTDGAAHLFRFGPDGLATGQEPGKRQYLSVSAGGDAYLVTLPNPWFSVAGGDCIVEVLVNSRQSPTGSAVSVAVRDPAIGTGLAYLANGSLSRAATVFRDVQAMLYGKVLNHLAAAAAGYVLVGTDLSEEPQEWDTWLANLREWFPGMSDGSILWGVRQLRLARTEDEVAAARDALVEGLDRGLPAFTLGLSWLIESLSEFPDDSACVQRLEQVRRLSWRVDMREPFVIVRLEDGSP